MGISEIYEKSKITQKTIYFFNKNGWNPLDSHPKGVIKYYSIPQFQPFCIHCMQGKL